MSAERAIQASAAAPQPPGPWRIERNHKLQFCVARETAEGKEFRESAGGKPSSFKTWAAADRVRKSLATAAEAQS